MSDAIFLTVPVLDGGEQTPTKEDEMSALDPAVQSLLTQTATQSHVQILDLGARNAVQAAKMTDTIANTKLAEVGTEEAAAIARVANAPPKSA